MPGDVITAFLEKAVGDNLDLLRNVREPTYVQTNLTGVSLSEPVYELSHSGAQA